MKFSLRILTGILSKTYYYLSTYRIVFILTFFFFSTDFFILAQYRVPIEKALALRMVEMRVYGGEYIDRLSVTLTKNTKSELIVVIPIGSYFVPQSKNEDDAYINITEMTFLFFASSQNNFDMPVVKYTMQPGTVSKGTDFFLNSPPYSGKTGLFDNIFKSEISHEAKQIAIWILQNPNITRDDIDSRYYKYYKGPYIITNTMQAVTADDPVLAFIALRQNNISLELFKLYTERVSLVHALCSGNETVRKFALTELIQMGQIDKSFLKSVDCSKLLIQFFDNQNRSLRLRAILGLEDKIVDKNVIHKLLEQIGDDAIVYEYPSIIWGMTVEKTIRDAVIEIIKKNREIYEDELVALLLKSSDYKMRLNGIEIFKGSQSTRIKAILGHLSKNDKSKVVREAAANALK